MREVLQELTAFLNENDEALQYIAVIILFGLGLFLLIGCLILIAVTM